MALDQRDPSARAALVLVCSDNEGCACCGDLVEIDADPGNLRFFEQHLRRFHVEGREEHFPLIAGVRKPDIGRS